MPTKTISCKPQTIVDTIEAIDNNEDKIAYVSNVLKTCAIPKPIKKKVKAKRQMTWYNCCVKIQSKGKPFGYATKSGVCKKENLSLEEIERYKELAKKDCLI